MKKISLYNVVQSEEIEISVLQVLRSGHLSSGYLVENFERSFSEFNKSKNVVACSDMTSALEIIFKIIGIENDDEILTTPFACLSTNSAIATSGAVAVWIDNKKNSILTDIEDIRNKITTKTKALILYHTAGYINNIDEIAKLCSENGIFLIEDCNNAIGSTYKNINVGNFGDFSVFSFYPNRYIHCIEGAIITCRNEKHADKAKLYRRFGIDFKTFRGEDGEINKESDLPVICNSKVLNNVNAAVGIAQFEELPNKLRVVKNNFITLKKLLSDFEFIKVIDSDIDSDPIPWVMFLLCNERDSLLHYLKENGIQVSKIHCRNDIYTGFGSSCNFRLNNLDTLESQLLGIPCGWWINDDDITYIVQCIRNWINWR